MKQRLTLTTVWVTMAVLIGIGCIILLAFSHKDRAFIPTAATLMILLVGATAGIVSMVYVRRVRIKRIADREPLSPDQIFSRYYKDSGLKEDFVVLVWGDIAKILALPAGKLRPCDKFNDELKPLTGWYFYDDHLEDLLTWADKYARNRGASVDPGEFKTLDDLVRRLSGL
jgi:hypothetical protein